MPVFKNILLNVDNRHPNEELVAKAIRIASSLQAKLKIVDVVPRFSWLTRLTLPDHQHLKDLLHEEKQAYLEEVAKQAQTQGLQDVDYRVLEGQTSVALMKFAVEHQSDLVIRHGKGKSSKEEGSLGRTSKQLLRHSPCPVWLSRTGIGSGLKKIAVCLDPAGDDEAESVFADQLLGLAFELAASLKSGCSIVHAFEAWNADMVKSRISKTEFSEWKKSLQTAAEKKFDEYLARVGKSVNDSAIHVVEGDPTIAIPQFVQQNGTDVVIMGTIGRSGLAGLMIGNTAERILENLKCDVLTVKPQV